MIGGVVNLEGVERLEDALAPGVTWWVVGGFFFVRHPSGERMAFVECPSCGAPCRNPAGGRSSWAYLCVAECKLEKLAGAK